MSGFNFAAKPATGAAPSSGFSFGGASTGASTPSFSFGGQASATANPAAGGGAAPAASGFGSAAPAASGFGSAAPAAPTSSGFSFGGGSGGGGFGSSKPSATSSSSNPAVNQTAAPASGFGLGGATNKPASSGFSFGGGGAAAAPAVSGDKPASSGFSFGGGAAAAAPATAAVAPAVSGDKPASSGFSFGGAAAAAASAPSSDGLTAASSLFLSPSSSASTNPPPSSSSSSSSSSSTTAATAAAAVAAATSGPGGLARPVTASADFTSKCAAKIVSQWTEEIEYDVTRFREQAERVSSWDNQLRDGQRVLAEVMENVGALMSHQESLKASCDSILAYQKDLEENLDALAATVDVEVDKFGPSEVSDSDLDREQSFAMADDLALYLDNMGENLQKLVSDFNEARGGSYDDPDSTLAVSNTGSGSAVAQVLQILNNHQDSLAWLDEQTKDLDVEVARLSRGLAGLSAVEQ